MRPVSLLFLLLLSGTIISQEISTDVDVDVSLSGTDFDISIIEVFPEHFPKVSVVFQARNELGEPLWLLTKDDFVVIENGWVCDILDVRNISENKPLNMALVFDHSGSMIENPLFMTDTSIDYQQLYHQHALPEGYIMSIDYAKEAVLNFFSADQSETDSLFFVGFSKTVDPIPSLTNDFAKFTSTVKNVEPAGNTAFFDALYAAIDSLSKHHSQPVVIALTDGADNSSVHTHQEVIDHANQNGVSLYIVGLGNVDPFWMNFMCEQTGGFFYQTNDASQLGEIYANIKKQLRSVYELDYESSLDYSDEALRKIKFSFTSDTLSMDYNQYEFELPAEVMAHLEKRHEELRLMKEEQQKQEEFQQNLIFFGGIGLGVLVLGIGTFVVMRRAKKATLQILSLNPNPFSDGVTVAFSPTDAGGVTLVITNVNGAVVETIPIATSEAEKFIDTSYFEPGIYFFNLSGLTMVSNVVKGMRG